MNFSEGELTLDGFLDGKLLISQPKQGYRAATDPVFLAASVDAQPGQKILELGCGVGVAMACLGFRVSDLTLFGVEIQPEYAALARLNLEKNRQTGCVVCGDLQEMPVAIKELNFDHVIANPPFFDINSHTEPSSKGKKTAHIGNADTVEIWTKAALRRLKPGGVVTLLHRAEALTNILATLRGNAGDINVLPIVSRRGKSARRVIVQARKGAKGPLQLLSPLVVHKGDKHGEIADDYSDKAKSILRNGGALHFW